MSVKPFLAFVLTVFWFAAPSSADSAPDERDHGPSVNSLLRGCAIAAIPRKAAGKISDDDFARLMDGMECLGVFAAVDQLNPMLPPNIRSCIPVTVTRGQQIRAFLAEATNFDTTTLNGDAAIVVAAILRHTWPCQ